MLVSGFTNPLAAVLKHCALAAVHFATTENAVIFVGVSTAWGLIQQTTLIALYALAYLREN